MSSSRAVIAKVCSLKSIWVNVQQKGWLLKHNDDFVLKKLATELYSAANNGLVLKNGC